MQKWFATIPFSFLRSVVMTVGEFEYISTFTIGPDAEYFERISYNVSTLLMFLIFVIVVSLLLSNLLVSSYILLPGPDIYTKYHEISKPKPTVLSVSRLV